MLLRPIWVYQFERLRIFFSKCWVFSIDITCNIQDHNIVNIPMKTTILGTIFELYLMITLLRSIATNLFIKCYTLVTVECAIRQRCQWWRRVLQMRAWGYLEPSWIWVQLRVTPTFWSSLLLNAVWKTFLGFLFAC